MRQINLQYNSQVRMTYRMCFYVALLVLSSELLWGQVKIGDNPTQISPYSLLELESDTKGLLLPRMSSQRRDEVFNQETPEGMFIFNTDLQMIQYFYQPLKKTTGEQVGEKVWNTVGEEIYSNQIPENPNPGDLFYNQETNSVFAWNEMENLWIPINVEGNHNEIGVTNPADTNVNARSGLQEVLIGSTDPDSRLGATALGSVNPGILYVNTSFGTLYIARDSDGDGTSDSWDRVSGRGIVGPQGPPGPQGPQGEPFSDDLGNHTATQNIDLGDFSLIDATGSAGNDGQLLSATASGLLWIDSSIKSGTGTPTVATITASPTAGDLYVDQTTGDVWTYHETTNTWVQQGGILSSGIGTPTVNTITATPTAGDLYIDESTGDIYTYVDTNNDGVGDTWENQSGVSADANNILVNGTDGLPFLSNNELGIFTSTGTPTALTATPNPTAGDLYVDQTTGDVWTYTSAGEWDLQEGDNIYTADSTFTESRIATLQNSDTLTFEGTTASNTVLFDTNVRLNEAVLDSDGDIGYPGQVLSRKDSSNSLDWVYPNTGIVSLTTGHYRISDEGTLFVRPSGTVIIRLPNPSAPENHGKRITVKRADIYTSPNELIVDSDGDALIDGTWEYNLNLSYQGYTFQAFGDEWHIIQRF